MANFEVGTGKAEIICNKTGIGMMGYGMYQNIVLGQQTPLYSRAFFIREPESQNLAVIVVAEICFPTISLKRGVLKKLNRFYPELGVTDENFLFSAQHTHSGPGGYSHYGFYNLTIPGFVPEVYQSIVNAITDSIVLAAKHLRSADIRLDSGEFPPEVEVAFNRSMKPYNQNPDVEPLPASSSHLAINRNMDLIRVDAEDGTALGSLNWFGVHTTSLSNDNHLVNSDNKGYAATFMEEKVGEESGNPEFLGVFAQETAGDVTPNYIWDRKKKWTRGKFANDVKSAQHNGKLQFDQAMKLWRSAKNASPLPGKIDSALIYADFSQTKVHPDFAGGKSGMRTAPGAVGVSMLAGTKEGPGMAPPVAFIARRLCELVEGYERLTSLFISKEKRDQLLLKYKWHGNKHIIIETVSHKVLGSRNVKALVIPGFVDGGIATFKDHHRKGAFSDHPWTPQILPLQLIRIGNIVLAGIPGEITTVAGQRLRKTLMDAFAGHGISKVILAPYTNAYSGYISTYEEYQLQKYEGGHTVFGDWTLAAYQTQFREMAREFVREMEKNEGRQQKKPPVFSPEELKKRSFVKGFKLGRKARKKAKELEQNANLS